MDLAVKNIKGVDDNSKRSLYARVRRYRERERKECEAIAIDLSTGGTSDNVPVITPGTRTSKKNDNKNNNKDGVGGETSLVKARNAAIANLPGYLDKSATSKQMSKKKKRSMAQTNQDNFDENCLRDYYYERYKDAYKKATTLLHENRQDPTKNGLPGYGAESVATYINNTMLNSPNDRYKIGRTALNNAVVLRGEFGVSPKKQGRKPKVPPELTKGLVLQAAMMQNSAEGEASATTMVATLEGLIAGTEYDGKVNTNYLFRKARKEHPVMFNPVKQINHEDRRADWLSYKNIMDWNDHAKKFLVAIGMAEDKPGTIRKYTDGLVCVVTHCN